MCGMAHSTQRTRAELWAHNGLELLLGLLQEQVGTHISPISGRSYIGSQLCSKDSAALAWGCTGYACSHIARECLRVEPRQADQKE